MEKRHRFLLGGIGGLIPLLVFAANGTLQEYLNSSVSAAAIVGFALRVAGMFVLGGCAVLLYPEVKKQAKLLQLGLSAPALVAGLMAAAAPKAAAPPAQSAGMALFPVVYAQAAPKAAPSAANLKHFTLPPLSPTAAFIKGLTSIQTTPDNVWFVIAGTFSSLENAQGFAAQINQKFSAFHADVYAPYPTDPYYTVVIGADLTQADAKALRDKAVQAGINKDTYYKTFPNLPLPPK